MGDFSGPLASGDRRQRSTLGLECTCTNTPEVTRTHGSESGGAQDTTRVCIVWAAQLEQECTATANTRLYVCTCASKTPEGRRAARNLFGKKPSLKGVFTSVESVLVIHVC